MRISRATWRRSCSPRSASARRGRRVWALGDLGSAEDGAQRVVGAHEEPVEGAVVSGGHGGACCMRRCVVRFWDRWSLECNWGQGPRAKGQGSGRWPVIPWRSALGPWRFRTTAPPDDRPRSPDPPPAPRRSGAGRSRGLVVTTVVRGARGDGGELVREQGPGHGRLLQQVGAGGAAAGGVVRQGLDIESRDAPQQPIDRPVAPEQIAVRAGLVDQDPARQGAEGRAGPGAPGDPESRTAPRCRRSPGASRSSATQALASPTRGGSPGRGRRRCGVRRPPPGKPLWRSRAPQQAGARGDPDPQTEPAHRTSGAPRWRGPGRARPCSRRRAPGPARSGASGRDRPRSSPVTPSPAGAAGPSAGSRAARHASASRASPSRGRVAAPGASQQVSRALATRAQSGGRSLARAAPSAEASRPARPWPRRRAGRSRPERGRPPRRRGTSDSRRGGRRGSGVRSSWPEAQPWIRAMRPRGESPSLAELGEGRAVRQAQPALDALVGEGEELVGGHQEVGSRD